MNPRGLQITTPTDTTIVLTRAFAAPRAVLWEAMFDPARMRRWMLPPPGWTLTGCVAEARVGGAVRMEFTSEDGGQVMTLSGVFTEVVPLERAVHTEKMELGGTTIGSLVETHEFTDQGGVTLMRITQVYESKEARDGALASGMNEGMEACYRELDAVVARAA